MRTRTFLIPLALLAASAPALAQKISVRSATPSLRARSRAGLDVVTAGKGFGPFAQAGGAAIDITDTASLASLAA